MDVHPTKNGIYSYWPTAISRILQCNKLHQSTENSDRPHLCRQTTFPGPFQPSLTYQLPHLPSGKRCDRHEKNVQAWIDWSSLIQQTKAKSNSTTKLVPIANVVPIDHHISSLITPKSNQVPIANSTTNWCHDRITYNHHSIFQRSQKTPSRAWSEKPHAATHRLRISFSPFKVLSRNSVHQLSVKSSIYVHKSSVI